MRIRKFLNKIMNRISINGVKISGDLVAGSSIQICNGKVTINGKDVTPDSKNINISIEGDVDTLDVDCCNTVNIKGNVKSVHTTSGDIECGKVYGDVKTVSGDVICGQVGGAIRTVSGDITHRGMKLHR